MTNDRTSVEESAGSSEASPRMVTFFEAASKQTALAVVLISAAGYLVSSLHQAQFGVLQSNPFRPRVLAAGVLYVTLLVVPLLIARPFRSQVRSKAKSLWKVLFQLWLTCSIIVFVPSNFFVYSDESDSGRFSWKLLLPIILLAAGVLLPKLKVVPSWLATTLELSVLAFFLISSVTNTLVAGHFTHESVALWLFGIGAVSLLIPPELSSVTRFEGQTNNPLIIILSSLLIFSTHVYPHINASWGGGSPVAITLFLSATSPIMQQRSIPVLLLDETDSGYYVRQTKDQKATFVPRAEVTLVHFSSDVTDSDLFKSK